MKWSEPQVTKLKELCSQGISNKEIAKMLNCRIEDVYAKRSQLGITIDKCKGMKPQPKKPTINEDFEKALPPRQPQKPKSPGLCRDVKDAFAKLQSAVLVAMAKDYRSERDAKVYGELAGVLTAVETSFNTILEL